MSETLDRSLLFLEEGAGITMGEASPSNRAEFDRAARGLAEALVADYPGFRREEARVISRWTGFVHIHPSGTSWASAQEREVTRVGAIRAMRMLLLRLPKGTEDARAAEAWIRFYAGEEKTAATVRVRGRVLTWDRRPARAATLRVRKFDPAATDHHRLLAKFPVREDGSFTVILPAVGWEWTIEGVEGELPFVDVFGPTALGKTVHQPWVVHLGKPGETFDERLDREIDERIRAGRR